MLQSGHGSRDRRTDGQMDRRTDGRTEWYQYTPQQLRCSGGIISQGISSYGVHILHPQCSVFSTEGSLAVRHAKVTSVRTHIDRTIYLFKIAFWIARYSTLTGDAFWWEVIVPKGNHSMSPDAGVYDVSMYSTAFDYSHRYISTR